MILRLPGFFGAWAYLLFLVFFVPGSGKAQTLGDALTAAYLNNPTLLGQRAKLRATDEQVPQRIKVRLLVGNGVPVRVQLRVLQVRVGLFD